MEKMEKKKVILYGLQGWHSTSLLPQAVLDRLGLVPVSDNAPKYQCKYIGGYFTLGPKTQQVLEMLGYGQYLAERWDRFNNIGYDNIYIAEDDVKYIDYIPGDPWTPGRLKLTASGLELLDYDFEKLRRRVCDALEKTGSHEKIVACANELNVKIF